MLAKSEQRRQDMHRFGQQFNILFKAHLQWASTCIYNVTGSQGASFNPKNPPLIEGQITLSNWSKSSQIRS